MADPACLDLDADFPNTRFRNVSFYDFERPIRFGDLYRTHFLFTNYSYLECSGAALFTKVETNKDHGDISS